MNLLFVANFPPGVGYAWNTIEEVFRGLAIRWRAEGGRVLIAYPPGGSGPSENLRAGGVEFVTFDYMRVKHGIQGVIAFCRLLRRERIDVLYLTDKPSWAWFFPLFRLAGVRRLVIHDRTSGDRSARPGVAGTLKRLWHQVPTMSADVLIGVSRFVAERMLRSGTPPERTMVVYNGIRVEAFADAAPGALAAVIGVPADTPVVFASGRAHEYKGIDSLIRAAALIEASGRTDAAIVYCGDGPDLPTFKALAAELGVERFHFLGRRGDVPDLLGSAAVAVVPSHWAEAFGLAVAEAMAAGVPVVATRTGGIPELIREGVEGMLVPPADPPALADAILHLLAHPDLRAAMGAAGRATARERFAIDRVVDELYPLVRPPGPSGAHGSSAPA